MSTTQSVKNIRITFEMYRHHHDATDPKNSRIEGMLVFHTVDNATDTSCCVELTRGEVRLLPKSGHPSLPEPLRFKRVHDAAVNMVRHYFNAMERVGNPYVWVEPTEEQV